eukprot:CAMPEP_0115465740 /NCGR_PEP_ID=MMETSP0271-20121206/49556_1 /TAXON_ID=71861 /ORGANISM="Scrippsiella trochoidea, Strain CCMP3099" /LENGTH=146 /DNA_ID=CAMNT_0002892689 /DNA_START=284 /DNA_END=724 /DNA_ORIENTATION=+
MPEPDQASIADQASDQEIQRADGAGDLVLRPRKQLRHERLRRDISHRFSEHPQDRGDHVPADAVDLDRHEAAVDPEPAHRHAREHEEAPARPPRHDGDLVAHKAEHWVHEDTHPVDELGGAHEHRLTLHRELCPLHGQQVRHPSGT